ncbi:helix-turn-helix domain-containing protein [Chitinophaga hostae]|uniref:helix-turn-helix domain-containing protein n=1 Tax=Chitinophaga hostae TaxID=2831022 RepID=UPI003F696FF6
MNITEEAPVIHHGRNIKIFRKTIDMKQDVLAKKLSDMGARQQDVSRLEKMEVIDDDTLNIVAKALNIDVKLLKEFDPDTAIRNICVVKENTFTDQSYSIGQQIVNPGERMVEVYERLVGSEKEKYSILNDRYSELKFMNDNLIKKIDEVVMNNTRLSEKNVELVASLQTVLEKISNKI